MLTPATLISIALFFAGLLLWLALMRIGNYRDRLVQGIGRTRFAVLLRVLIAAPLAVAVLVAASLQLAYGTADGLLLARLAHMSLVLGAWTAGTLGLFLFLLPYRLKLDFPLPALLASLLALPIAIYLIPLSRFLPLFQPAGQIGLGAAAGVFSFAVSEVVLVGFLRSLAANSENPTQPESETPQEGAA